MFRFETTNKYSVFIELTSFKSFDSEVPSFYFGSMPPFARKTFLQKCFVNFLMPNTALEQDVIAADITIALVTLYLHASDVGLHQHSTFNRSRAATCSEALNF